jgi:hypothetical protein
MHLFVELTPAVGEPHKHGPSVLGVWITPGQATLGQLVHDTGGVAVGDYQALADLAVE